MGKKDKNKKKIKGAEKTAIKTSKKLATKQKKFLLKVGEADIEEIVSKLEAEESRLKEVNEIICEPPTPRSNFSICAHPEKDELILFGGELYDGQKVCVYNDLYFYNISKNEWKLVKSPAGPTPRSGHQMVSVASDGGQLWLFGGEHASPSQLQFYHYRDLWVLRLGTKKWEKINALNAPSPRSGHRMVVSKKKLIVFGGFYDNNQQYMYYNDLHMFSLENYTWLNIEISGVVIPPPRSGCCIAASQDGKIYVWGGYSKRPVKKEVDIGMTHTDMYALVPDKTQVNTKFKWVTVKPSGIRPAPRSSVGFTASPNNKVYCFGGVMDIKEDEENIEGHFGNDLYCLDLLSTTWKLLEINKKERKSKKDKETMDCDEEIQISPPTTFTTDGVFTVTVAGNQQQQSATTSNSTKANSNVKISKNCPSPRMNAGLVICKGILYVYGGIYEENNKQQTLADLYSIDLHKLDEWKTIIPNSLCSHEWFDSDSESSSSDGSEDDSDDNSDEESDDSDLEEMDTD